MPMRVRIVRPSPACTAAQMPLRLWLTNTTCRDPRASRQAMARERIRHGLSNITSGSGSPETSRARYPVRMRNPRQRAEAQPGTLIFGLPQQRQIQRLFRQRPRSGPLRSTGDYPHLRMMPFKLPEDLRHQRFAKIFLHTKVDLAGEPLTLQRAQGFIIERQQASGVAHQLFAFAVSTRWRPCLVTSAAPH